MMEIDERKFVRAVVRRVHPDLFTAYPQERLRNSESLKARPSTKGFVLTEDLITAYGDELGLASDVRGLQARVNP